ncbi:ADP-ribosylglycohydrolase family protein [Amycolatopsis sp. NBC_01480]|uniref:ADP-ribosylglycohydrolase family protein n=1 Tax=Amycolatopsis sp. NBC_01480 TaxID=2903562 RepID=UPI002E2BC716|nr:ADP-ribosylglycohydrolase family protein [Amycolatopsis sp. NBC_01480]
MRHTWTDKAVHRSRLRGCLLAGGLGDALGYPVETLSRQRIEAKHGPRGLTDPVTDADGVAVITDNTQLSLFTAEGFRNGYVQVREHGIDGAMSALVREAYLRWLDTQDHPAPPPVLSADHRVGRLRLEPWLYARRSPGPECLSGLRSGQVVKPFAEPAGQPGPVNPSSKAYATVVRSAPFGFLGDAPYAFRLAANCAQLTHGHPTGYYAAGTFAAIIAHLVAGESLDVAVSLAMRELAGHPGHEETTEALRHALDLAAEGKPAAEKAELLGTGRTAEEALAIGVYAALVPFDSAQPEDDITARLCLSVNHSGASDSTGSVCGNLLGVLHGDVNLPWRWLSRLEGRAVIAQVADDFAAETGQADGS